MNDRVKWFAETMVGMADLSFVSTGTTEYADYLTARFAQLMAPAEVAMIVVDEHDVRSIAAATTERMHALTELELSKGEGPGIDCLRTGKQLLDQNLDEAVGRWPSFAPAAMAEGFETAHALPLRHKANTIGAVVVLGERSRVATELDYSIARTLVAVGAIGVLQQRASAREVERSEQLQRALTSRVAIEQAKGVVAARLEVDVDAAFSMLRDYSRRTNRKLVEVSGDVVADELAMSELLAGGRKAKRR